MTHTVKGFSVVNEAELSVLLEFSCFFSIIQQMLEIWSLVPLPFLNLVWRSGGSWFTYCWSLASENFEHYFASLWDECNCVVLEWNTTGPFPVLWPLLSFPNLLAYWVHTFTASSSGFEIAQLLPCCCCCCCWVSSVVSDSVWPHRWQPTGLPHPWDSPGKNTGVGCHFLLQCMKVKSEREVTQSCPTLSDPMDFSLPGSSVHGIFQARALEWGAIAFSAAVAIAALKLSFWKSQGTGTHKFLLRLLLQLLAGWMATQVIYLFFIEG